MCKGSCWCFGQTPYGSYLTTALFLSLALSPASLSSANLYATQVPSAPALSAGLTVKQLVTNSVSHYDDNQQSVMDTTVVDSSHLIGDNDGVFRARTVQQWVSQLQRPVYFASHQRKIFCSRKNSAGHRTTRNAHVRWARIRRINIVCLCSFPLDTRQK